jgi:hypothetical protein
MSLFARVRRLETSEGIGGNISVWCLDRANVPATIEAMIADGEVTEADRSRCVYWADRQNVRPGSHERALDALAALDADPRAAVHLSKRERR